MNGDRNSCFGNSRSRLRKAANSPRRGAQAVTTLCPVSQQRGVSQRRGASRCGSESAAGNQAELLRPHPAEPLAGGAARSLAKRKRRLACRSRHVSKSSPIGSRPWFAARGVSQWGGASRRGSVAPELMSPEGEIQAERAKRRFGLPGWIRTSDLRLRRPLLYPG